ncbi:MAG: hypothetical protein AAF436_11375 [Myxococcota bacterium]
MKLIGFICAFALAGAMVGCGDDSSGTGATGGAAGTGGSGGGTGGTGGTGATGGEDLCTNAADTAVYDSTEYTNEGGEEFSGTDAVAEIAADCLDNVSTLNSMGCGAEVGDVLTNNNNETQAALAACVVQCVVDQEVDLSANCLSCYGDTVSCGAAFCAGPCATDVNAPACITCRCGTNAGDADCFGEFDTCSGLPRVPDDCAM